MSDFLMKLYNTLCMISTRGEDTITMSGCLMAIKNYVSELQENNDNKEE